MLTLFKFSSLDSLPEALYSHYNTPSLDSAPFQCQTHTQ